MTRPAIGLAIPAQVFGDRRQASRYRFTVCSPTPGLVASTTGYAVVAEHGLGALAADTVVLPGYLALDDAGDEVGADVLWVDEEDVLRGL